MDQRPFHHLIDQFFCRIECRRRTLRDVRHPIAAQALQLMLTQRKHIVLADLHHHRIDALTPREALDLLYEWKRNLPKA